MPDLDKALSEAAIEYRKRIEANPDLGRVFSKTDTGTSLEGRNLFEVNVHLIRQMREAYETNDKEALAKIPLYYADAGIGTNSMTYCSALFSKTETPFYNETVGENIHWITNIFERVDSCDKKTYLLRYLRQEIKEFQAERNSVRDDIMTTPAYLQAQEEIEGKRGIKAKGVLREAYRDEELKRRDAAIRLCDKAEHLYSLASRLYEELRPADR